MTEDASGLWVFDGHNDLPTALRTTAGYSVAGLAEARDELHTDLPRLRRGRVGAQFWSAWTPSTLSESEGLLGVIEQIDAIHRLVEAYPDDLQIAYTSDDVHRARATDRIASLIGIEGGHALATSLGVIRTLGRLGVRYVTLTHNDNTRWADSATDVVGVGGLDDDGREIVRTLQRHGILVDISHTSAATQRDALAVAEYPVLFSHSSAFAVTPHPRNVTDDVLEALPGNGGVVQVTFVPYFVSSAVYEWSQRFAALREDVAWAPHDTAWYPGPSPVTERARDRAPFAVAPQAESPLADAPERVHAWLGENPQPQATLEDVVAHLEHVRELVGIDHLGISGDYDGVDVQPVGLEDVGTYPALLDALAARGWSTVDLEKLAWRNVDRVLQAADAAPEPLWPGSSPR